MSKKITVTCDLCYAVFHEEGKTRELIIEQLGSPADDKWDVCDKCMNKISHTINMIKAGTEVKSLSEGQFYKDKKNQLT